MLNFKNWAIDRYVRAVIGLASIAVSVFFHPAHSTAILIAGIILAATALSNRCPFNACAVKAPKNQEADNNNGKGR
jgi:hypothetical protein